jgi:hypothetical protein
VTRKGDRYPGQQEWLEMLAACGTMAFVCRPKRRKGATELSYDRFLGRYLEVGYDDMLEVLNVIRAVGMGVQPCGK